ncbi:MAG TPA: serine/threonine-protein kinase [Chroococcales cyanobacterium]
MSEGEAEKRRYANSCDTCGKVFDLSISFCPHDGTRLVRELVTATSREIMKITRIKSTGSTVSSASAPTAANAANAANAASAAIKDGSSGSQAPAASAAPAAPAEKTGNGDSSAAESPSSGGSKPLPGTPLLPHEKQSLSDKDLLLGALLDDKYQIYELIGQGGMSLVYLARHKTLKNRVAVKTLLPHLAVHEQSLQRFHQEARAASNLKHPNVITVHDFGTTPDGNPYLVMDYVDGISLGDLLEKEKHLPAERSLKIFVQMADALYHAHSKGIIHRDLKPTNILLVEKDGVKDQVRIVDFGIAKLLPQEGAEAVSLTQTGEVFGSPLYMSPEQCKGEKLDARADVYSMGCLMYETLTGKNAIAGDNTMEVLFNQINQVPISMSETGVSVPQRVERLVFKALAKDAAQRYQSMAQLRDELQACLDSQRYNLLGQLSSHWELFC